MYLKDGDPSLLYPRRARPCTRRIPVRRLPRLERSPSRDGRLSGSSGPPRAPDRALRRCPVPAIGTPIPTDPDLPPILVVNGVTDSETPYPWGQALSADLPNSVLLSAQAFGHTVFYTSTCVADAAGAFYLEGTLPAAGSVCRAED